MKRTTCAACGYDDLEMFLDLGLSPIADAYTSTHGEVSPRYPLQVAVCTGCWLVQLLEVVDHETLFGTGYSFYSSASAPLSDYHERYAGFILDYHKPEAKRLTVEIGCNDGDMLRHFAKAGCKAVGVDPASGPVAVARERGLDVTEEPFNMDVAHDIREQLGPAGVIVANHVLAHVESVSEVVRGIAHLLADDGAAFIEVQYLPDLLVNNAFDLVYHEHRNFFSLTSLRSALAQWGLNVARVELTDRQGGSLRVTATKRPLGPNQRAQDAVVAKETWLCQPGVYRGFQGRIERIRDRLVELLYTGPEGGTTIGYGAPAKATTLLNYCGLDSYDLASIIDSTPAKQGRFVPGTGIKIIPPREDLSGVDDILVLAWNYAPAIIRNHPDFKGRWIVPIPAPMVL